MTIKAIETEYNGHRFRSRLEARWAVFFDALGVKYEYEPEGFQLPSGGKYLPDFRVKCYGTRGDRDSRPFDLYIEVKGRMTEDDARRIMEFVDRIYVDHHAVINNPTLIVGDIPSRGCCCDNFDVGSYEPMDGVDIYPFNYATVDGDYFAAYPAAHEGDFYLWGDDSNYINRDDIDEVEMAYDRARKARFEHGEKPVIAHG